MSSTIIAPFQTGLEQDIQPWLAPSDSFSELNNFHIQHGFLEKRNGRRYFGEQTSPLENGTPITGFAGYVTTASGTKIYLAFDTISAYRYDGVNKIFNKMTPNTIFNGNQTDYISSTIWYSTAISTTANRLYFTNGLPFAGGVNGIYYYEGGNTVTLLDPTATPPAPDSPYGAKILLSLGQRLIALHTYEGGGLTQYPQRARWCAKQNPENWDDSQAGGGGYVDAATSEQIISAQTLQNQIIVYFTDSVWTLLPTSDPDRSFRWKKLNSFRSCGSRNGSIGYDTHIRALGNRGITATDGNNTQRIDKRISDFTVNNISQTYFSSVICERDYNNRRWWTLYNDGRGAVEDENNSVLIYDDDSGAYSTYSLKLNALGYGNDGDSYTLDIFVSPAWPSPYILGGDIRLRDFNKGETLQSYFVNPGIEKFIGGDYEGYIYNLEQGNTDVIGGEQVSIQGTFSTAAWNPFKDEGKEALFSYIDFYISTSLGATATVDFFKNTELSPYKSENFDFSPDLDFVTIITGVSKDNPETVTAPQHGLSTGHQIYIYLVKGMVQINSGQEATPYTVTVVDENTFTLDGIDSTLFDTYTTDGGIYLLPFFETKTWIRVFGGGIGFQHSIGLTTSGEDAPIRIHAFKPHFEPKGTRLINK
jgi:hypothetical protein